MQPRSLACTCPHCGALIHAPPACAGRLISCTSCRQNFHAHGTPVPTDRPAAHPVIRFLILIPFIAIGAWIISKGLDFIDWISSL